MIKWYTKKIYRDMVPDLKVSFPLEMRTEPGSVLSYIAGFMARREARLRLRYYSILLLVVWSFIVERIFQ
jgi:hypothetical protein